MIDTHAHLYDKAFDDDRDEMLRRALDNGIDRIVVPPTDSESYARALNLCAKRPDMCFLAAGLHPTSVKENHEEELSFVEQQLSERKHIAVGETGIDCYWSLEYLDRQRDAFAKQLKLAERHSLPVIIHSRNAFSEIFPILDRLHNPKIKGVFHAFSGSRQDYFRIKGYETFKIGVGGPVTFKNSTLPEVLKEVPVADMLTETDAPYLTPHPFRGKRNESCRIPLIVEKIAEIKQLSFQSVAETTAETARNLFGI
ncbi:MAG: TatD family hydrolase [Prevotellaceae bacterium]|jgi:TatD DNase family protein|nr:TatD family hydrolase [Prevotellaceae bacterium]